VRDLMWDKKLEIELKQTLKEHECYLSAVNRRIQDELLSSLITVDSPGNWMDFNLSKEGNGYVLKYGNRTLRIVGVEKLSVQRGIDIAMLSKLCDARMNELERIAGNPKSYLINPPKMPVLTSQECDYTLPTIYTDSPVVDYHPPDASSPKYFSVFPKLNIKFKKK